MLLISFVVNFIPFGFGAPGHKFIYTFNLTDKFALHAVTMFFILAINDADQFNFNVSVLHDLKGGAVRTITIQIILIIVVMFIKPLGYIAGGFAAINEVLVALGEGAKFVKVGVSVVGCHLPI